MNYDPLSSDLRRQFELMKKKGNPIGYNSVQVDNIKTKIKNIKLPIFTNEEISKFSMKLDQADKKFRGNKLEIREKFLFLIDVFRFLYALDENDENLKKINEYILAFDYFIGQILDAQNKKSFSDNLLSQSTTRLKLELDLFCAKYYYFIEQKDTIQKGNILDEVKGK